VCEVKKEGDLEETWQTEITNCFERRKEEDAVAGLK
jgi:hypothetical protein